MKKGAYLIVILFFLVSCTPPDDDFPVGEYQPSTFPSEKQVRPLIEKKEVPIEEREVPAQADKPEGIPVPQLSTPIETYRLSIGYAIYGMNDSIGLYSPLFTKYEFPELLRSSNIVGGQMPVMGRYEQFLKLLGGRIFFTGDEFDQVSDFLVYRDEEPIFQYEFILQEGTFLDFVGHNIWFLGNEYTIEAATKKDIVLRNVETGDLLILGGGPVSINQEVLQDTDSRMLGNALYFIGKANADFHGDDIFVPPGGSIQEYLAEPTLLTNKIDVRYVGILDVPGSLYEFRNKNSLVELRITNDYRHIKIPLGRLEGSGFVLGDDEGDLHVKEAVVENDYKVRKNDYFVLTVPRIDKSQVYYNYKHNDTGMVSAVLQYKDINTKQQRVEFVSDEGFAIEAFYNGTPGDADGFIPFAGHLFKFFVGADGSLAVDMNGDRRVTGAIVDFVVNDAIIDLPSKESFSGPGQIGLRFLNYEQQGMREETATVEIIPSKDFTYRLITDLKTLDLEHDNNIAVSAFGTQYFLFNQDDDSYEEIIITHPWAERLAEIVVESR